MHPQLFDRKEMAVRAEDADPADQEIHQRGRHGLQLAWPLPYEREAIPLKDVVNERMDGHRFASRCGGPRFGVIDPVSDRLGPQGSYYATS